MDFSAAHVDMVIAAYGLTAFSLIALVIYLVRRDRKLARELKQSINT